MVRMSVSRIDSTTLAIMTLNYSSSGGVEDAMGPTSMDSIPCSLLHGERRDPRTRVCGHVSVT